MESKTFIGVYHNETELLAKMEELKTHGYSEEDMYVTVKDEDAVSMVRGQTDVEVETVNNSWGDRFMSFLSGVNPIRDAFRNMDVTDEEADRYYNEVDNGGMLLYVDRDYGTRYKDDYDPSRTVGIADGNRSTDSGENLDPIDYDRLGSSSDPNLGANAYGRDEATRADNDPLLNTADALRVDTTSDTNRTLSDEERLRTEDTLDTDRTLNDEEKLRLHEERLNVNKERVQTGEVHVEKEVVEEEQVIDVPVEREEVFVERRPVTDGDLTTDRDGLTGKDHAFTDDDETIRVPITEERVEVTKKPVVTEEVVIGKRKVEDTETVRDTVRREEAHVEEDNTGETTKKDKDRGLF